jgi:hypothetical protein
MTKGKLTYQFPGILPSNDERTLSLFSRRGRVSVHPVSSPRQKWPWRLLAVITSKMPLILSKTPLI